MEVVTVCAKETDKKKVAIKFACWQHEAGRQLGPKTQNKWLGFRLHEVEEDSVGSQIFLPQWPRGREWGVMWNYCVGLLCSPGGWDPSYLSISSQSSPLPFLPTPMSHAHPEACELAGNPLFVGCSVQLKQKTMWRQHFTLSCLVEFQTPIIFDHDCNFNCSIFQRLPIILRMILYTLNIHGDVFTILFYEIHICASGCMIILFRVAEFPTLSKFHVGFEAQSTKITKLIHTVSKFCSHYDGDLKHQEIA
jgi:hypothetical protein